MSKFYVTTAIPYVNAPPHIGFAMELLEADVLARYHRLAGDNVLFSTGVDEHGGKIAESAAEQKLSPQKFADQVTAQYEELIKLLEIGNDRFIRTTSQDHIKRSQAVWQKLTPYIYKSSYIGWYCTGDEEFFSDQVVKSNKGICPEHNRPYERVEEENYFFKLSAFDPKIREAIENDSLQIIPASRKNEVLSLINTGLEDISISRPKGKIDWGIPVPGDDEHTMYVWFEALLNYITVLGYPDKADFKNYWPADVQVIGKGILRFHAAIWPGMLLALGLPLPKTIYVHGYVTIDNKKISKSIGNVISPKEVIERYGSEAFRYFFLRHIPSYEDGNFTWQRLDDAYNNELADQLGNAVGRVAAMIQQYQSGLIGNMPEPQHDLKQYHEAINSCRFDRALDEAWEQVRGLNQYIDESKPWEIAKANDPTHLQEVLSYAASCLIEISDMLEPFMPATAQLIKDSFSGDKVKTIDRPLFPKSKSETK